MDRLPRVPDLVMGGDGVSQVSAACAFLLYVSVPIGGSQHSGGFMLSLGH